MLPLQKVKEIVSRYNSLEKELSSGSIDPKQFANKSKEYSNLGNIISTAKEYINFDNEKKDLEQILQDQTSDKEIIEMAQKDLEDLDKKRKNNENQLKIFLLPSIAVSIDVVAPYFSDIVISDIKDAVIGMMIFLKLKFLK